MTKKVYELQARTKQYALRILRLYCALPKTTEAQVLGRQMLRSGTSVGAPYREGMRARSVAEFVSKIEGELQELEETAYWLELMIEGEIMPESRLQELFRETDELIAMFVASVKTAKPNR